MNSTKNRLLIGAALLIALGLGFGVAQFVPHAEHEAQAEDGDHASHDEGHEEMEDTMTTTNTRESRQKKVLSH